MGVGNAEHGEIEIVLYKVQPEAIEVELRVNDPGTQGEIAPARGQIRISPETLQEELFALQNDPDQYGEALAKYVFQDQDIRELYSNSRAAFESRGMSLRLRIQLGPSLPELHGLSWELIRDPLSQKTLATSERIVFSRFILSRDWRVIKLRPKTELKALIAVSSPSDLAESNLADVDTEGEIARARGALEGIQATVIGNDRPLTLNRLIDAIRQGADILYLICHGEIARRTGPCLLMQQEDGTTARVAASDVAQRIAELIEVPRLIVLASCESAGKEYGDRGHTAQIALAPRLAEAGVPAVIAMQGKISMETVKQAMPVFFTEMLKDGQIDRAMAVARGMVRERFDAWIPALFLRLKHGRIWYEPGFAGDSKEAFDKWKAICSSIDDGEFIPILGPELGEEMFGGTQELASALADEEALPLAAHDRTDLAKVTQFISTDQSRRYAVKAVNKQFKSQFLKRLGNSLNGNSELGYEDLIDQALKRSQSNPDEPYHILAALNAKVYLNASPETILCRALLGAEKEPDAIFSLWRENGVKPQPQNHSPSVKTPWVYHVFGLLPNPDTLVLTEDDFFDYLIASSKLNLFWDQVTGRLVESSLLFLGFRLNDWRFRVLFRMIMASEGRGSLSDYAHVGVQVNPDENNPADVERIMKDMKSYFEKGKGGVEISIYWGSSADFLKELRSRMAI